MLHAGVQCELAPSGFGALAPGDTATEASSAGLPDGYLGFRVFSVSSLGFIGFRVVSVSSLGFMGFRVVSVSNLGFMGFRVYRVCRF